MLLAPGCAACGLPLERPTGGAVCDGCWLAIRPLTPPLCDACGDPLPTWRPGALRSGRCVRCRRTRRLVERARAVGAYDGSLRAIVQAFKYDGRRSLAARLAALMRERAGDLLDGVDAAVPVPLHATRRLQRGFNQSADLARHLGLPICEALVRVRATAAQATLPAGQRHRNVRGAFAATAAAARLRDRTVVLVDDVSTTGATLEACARALRAAGAGPVRALTAARVVAPPR